MRSDSPRPPRAVLVALAATLAATAAACGDEEPVPVYLGIPDGGPDAQKPVVRPDASAPGWAVDAAPDAPGE